MIEMMFMMIEIMMMTTIQFIAIHQCSESSNLICWKHPAHDDDDDNDNGYGDKDDNDEDDDNAM